jgi:hypothetical protein
MYSREEEDSDGFGFEDEESDITESKDISSSAASSKKNKF